MLLLVICFIFQNLLTPTPAAAPDALHVQLRDQSGAGVRGVAVSVVDLSGRVTFARATTDENGVVRFSTLPASDVRVVVQGSLGGGTVLTLPGQDARGIAITLGLPPARLDLRVENDGLVLPEPATMLAPDVGVPASAVAPIPTAPLAVTPALIPAATSAPALQANPVEPLSERATPIEQIRLLFVVMLIALLTILAVFLGVRRRA